MLDPADPGSRARCAPPSRASSPAIPAAASASWPAPCVSLAETVHTPIELHLFSDMQRSDMPASFSDMALPANVTLVLHPVVTKPGPELDGRKRERPRPGLGSRRKARVQAVIAGYRHPGRHAHRVAAWSTARPIATDTRRGPRATDAPPSSFQSLDVPYGFSRCEVRIDSADALPADDASLFAVERSDPEHVLFVHEPSDTRSPLYFGAALDLRRRIGLRPRIGHRRTGGATSTALQVRLRRSLRRRLAARVIRKRSAGATCAAAAAS